MSRLNLIVALLVPAAGVAVLADGRPGSMNFRNVHRTEGKQKDPSEQKIAKDAKITN